MDSTAAASSRVEEIQGVYGPFTFPESLLQRIWFRREYDGSALRTVEGERLSVLDPGRWNHLGGPDFQDARLIIGDREVRGAVELHLHARDWHNHGHARDEAYDGVVLHAVLFPPASGVTFTRGAGGRAIPLLVVLPWLHHDLEEYAAEAAIERLAGRPASQIGHWLDVLEPRRAADELRERADRRWRAKVHFAKVRLEKLGWAGACHQTAMEVLGYRFNRTPMLRAAAACPLSAWVENPAGAEVAAMAVGGDEWARSGVRPANFPEVRLRQYARWVSAVPNWPEAWASMAADWSMVSRACAGLEAGEARRVGGLAARRKSVGRGICGGALGGSRLDTLICDGLLPLWSARSGADLADLWRVWYPGDQPAELAGHLRRLGLIDGRAKPAAHGLFQGLLDWLRERSEK